MFKSLKIKIYIYILWKIYKDMRKNTIYHTGKQVSQLVGIIKALEKTIEERG